MKKIAADRFTTRLAFTLIELLVVITIIVVLASLTVPVLKSLKRREYISKTQAELAQLETAIDSYKAAYGFYPPDNPNDSSYPFVNQLYYELLGTVNYTNAGVIYYQTLDSSAQISSANVTLAFPGVGGFINCTKPGAGEDAPAARSFLSDLKPNQYVKLTVNTVANVVLLVASVGGPDQNYQPFNNTPGVNPWRYIAQGTNNPGGYDLWVQLVLAGKTNLVCNWNKQVVINSRLR
jgi:prepilin-type N-terminal cleavage/methylation domain-containing protein